MQNNLYNFWIHFTVVKFNLNKTVVLSKLKILNNCCIVQYYSN